MGLSLVVLGASGSYPGPGAACSGYLVRCGAVTIWLDAGSGTLANLQRHVGLADVSAVVLSHAHPDHYSDIEGFRVATTYGEHAREGVPVYAPSGVRDRVTEDEGPALAWRQVSDGDTVGVGDVRLAFSRTDHGPETLAVRIEADGKVLGYSADTGPAWSLAALGGPLDLALCEASYTEDKQGAPGHLTARQAGRSARDAGARRLLLTHLWPTVDPARSLAEASDAFARPAELAIENEEYVL